MKKYQIDGFKKLPTSESEANYQMEEEKNAYLEKLEQKDTYNIFKNKWLLIFLITFSIIFTMWVSSELYWLLFEYNIITGQSKLSIIINSFNKKHNLTHLLRTLMDQSITSYELIITKNFFSNFSSLAFEKFKRRNVNIKFIQYRENDTKLKIRIDSALSARGEYILFINPEEYFSTDCLGEYYKTAIRNEYDITQYDSFHDKYEINSIINQPKLFDGLFLFKDVIQPNEFHLTGKIIKKEIFLESVRDIDTFYLENNNIYFEQSMILFKVYKKAKTFIKLQNKQTNRKCRKYFCPYTDLFNKDSYRKSELRDILIYLKFLIQYTDDKVIQKRMAAKFFIDIIVQKKKTKYNFRKYKDLIALLDEIIDLYSNCEIINEYDIKIIKSFRRSIK